MAACDEGSCIGFSGSMENRDRYKYIDIHNLIQIKTMLLRLQAPNNYYCIKVDYFIVSSFYQFIDLFRFKLINNYNSKNT